MLINKSNDEIAVTLTLFLTPIASSSLSPSLQCLGLCAGPRHSHIYCRTIGPALNIQPGPPAGMPKRRGFCVTVAQSSGSVPERGIR